MIRIGDALTLSVTKLKTRRVRLIVTTVVSGLFFVILAFLSSVADGTLNSIEQFSEDGFGSRYITRVDNIGGPDDYQMYQDKTLIAKAKIIDAELIASKKAAAKELGVTYDAKMEQLSVAPAGPNGEETIVDTPQVQELLRQARIEKSASYFATLDTAENQYSIVNRYYSVGMTEMSFSGQSSVPTIIVIKDGVEQNSSVQQNQFGTTGFSTLPSGLSAMDDSLLETFLLPNQSFSNADAIPVIAPYTAAEESLGLAKLPSSASSQTRLERLKEVREKAAGKTFEVCLRNQASLERQGLAEQQKIEMEQGKDKKGYIKPDVVYEIANEACRDVVVTRDVRAASIKKEELKLEEFERRFGKQDPAQRIVTFSIAGVVSDPPGFEGFSVKSLITSLLTSNLGSGWFIPISSQSKIPEFEPLFANSGKIVSYNNGVFFEFETPEDTKKFVKEKSCDFSGFSMDPIADCTKKGTPFFIASFGSNSVALNDAKNGFQTFFIRSALIVAAVSVIIMMGTVGKVIADSRRETAVFRAIGAKRIDIAQIYVLYSSMLGIIVATFSVGVGFLIATLFDAKYAEGLTVDALIAYNSSNLNRTFNIVGVNEKELLILYTVIVLAGLISAIPPLVSNLKRNPIKDMRDER